MVRSIPCALVRHRGSLRRRTSRSHVVESQRRADATTCRCPSNGPRLPIEDGTSGMHRGDWRPACRLLAGGQRRASGDSTCSGSACWSRSSSRSSCCAPPSSNGCSIATRSPTETRSVATCSVATSAPSSCQDTGSGPCWLATAIATAILAQADHSRRRPCLLAHPADGRLAAGRRQAVVVRGALRARFRCSSTPHGSSRTVRRSARSRPARVQFVVIGGSIVMPAWALAIAARTLPRFLAMAAGVVIAW